MRRTSASAPTRRTRQLARQGFGTAVWGLRTWGVHVQPQQPGSSMGSPKALAPGPKGNAFFSSLGVGQGAPQSLKQRPKAAPPGWPALGGAEPHEVTGSRQRESLSCPWPVVATEGTVLMSKGMSG